MHIRVARRLLNKPEYADLPKSTHPHTPLRVRVKASPFAGAIWCVCGGGGGGAGGGQCLFPLRSST